MLKLMRVVVVGLTTLFCGSVLAGTNVIIENHTSLTLLLESSQSGYRLSRSKWDVVNREVPPASRKTAIRFNRDSGIKDEKLFYFKTNVFFQKGGQDLDHKWLSLHQGLRGQPVNSHMWQSVAMDDGREFQWHDDRKWRHRSLVVGNSYIKISYRAVPDGTDDNVLYRFEEFPIFSTYGPVDLKLVNYNIYMRPISLFHNGQTARSSQLADYLRHRDILIFSEAFDDDARRDLLYRLRRDGYHYTSKIVGSDRGFEQDGGVIAVSKWPLIEEDEFLFEDVCNKAFEDCLSDKGILYAKILKEGLPIHIFATHLQAGYTNKDRVFRRAQLHMLRSFIESKKIPSDEPVIITGDFNIPEEPHGGERSPVTSLNGLPSRALHYFVPSIGENESENTYQQMLLILGATTSPNQGIPYSFDPSRNDLAADDPAEFVDHILWSESHRAPIHSHIQVMELKTRSFWRSHRDDPPSKDLSDHFPVQATFTF